MLEKGELNNWLPCVDYKVCDKKTTTTKKKQPSYQDAISEVGTWFFCVQRTGISTYQKLVSGFLCVCVCVCVCLDKLEIRIRTF